MADALWQILSRGYLNHLISLYENGKYDNKWENIIIRAIVFYRTRDTSIQPNKVKNEETYLWKMSIAEYKYSIQEAKNVNSIFTETNEIGKRILLKNHDNLKSKNG